MPYTLLRLTSRGIVLADYHLRRLGADTPGAARDLVLGFAATAEPGVWALWLEGGTLDHEPRPGSRLRDGMPVRLLPSPVANCRGLLPKPPSPGPYDAVRRPGVATLLCSPDGTELWEACSAAVLGWDGARLVCPPDDRPRVWSTSEWAVREHLPVVASPIPATSTMPILLLNAVKNTCAPCCPGRVPFPAQVRDEIERLFESLTCRPAGTVHAPRPRRGLPSRNHTRA